MDGLKPDPFKLTHYRATLAEKLSALADGELFRGAGEAADVAKAIGILERAGVGNPPVPGDELPDDIRACSRYAECFDDECEAARM